MSVSDVAAAVQARFGSQMLIELTNDSGAATTVDSDVLAAACADSIGEFERIVGVSHDSGNYSHLAILARGAVYFLEFYKARDASFVKSRGNDFYGALTNFRKTAYILPSSNSNITHDRETSGTRPDMARDKNFWGDAVSQTYKGTIEP